MHYDQERIAPLILEIYLSIKEKIYQRAFYQNCYRNIIPLTVLNEIQKEIAAICRKRDQLTLSSFNSIISKEIKDQPAPFIYERLGEKYRHYFIDEFQDTSELQWKNLIPLVANALESEFEEGQTGTLFLVGDTKQAIYRWRGGKAEQFLDLVNKNKSPFVALPKVENLPKNYRSASEIVAFNNSFFKGIAPFLEMTITNNFTLKVINKKPTKILADWYRFLLFPMKKNRTTMNTIVMKSYRQ